jgi:hypothetical protein
MSEQRLLSEEQRQLMGIAPREFGGLPAMFARGDFKEGSDPKPKAPAKRPLEERRSLTLFKGMKEMKNAMDRAHKLVARVNATIQSSRESSTKAPMQEKARAEMYRLDQEMATAMDSIRASTEALEALDAAHKAAKREARQSRRQGRR